MAESNKELATAPYASWTTFVRFLEHLAENGVPQQIDRTVWPKMSGATQSNIRVALTFLKLTDCDGIPSDTLQALVASHGKGAEWKSVLREVIVTAYAPLIGDLSLETGTADQLWKCFRENGGVRGSTLGSAVRFYLAGLREAEVRHSSYFKAPPRPRRTKGKQPTQNRPDVGDDPPALKTPGTGTDRESDGRALETPPGEPRAPGWRIHSFHLPNYQEPVKVRVPERITDTEWSLIDQFMSGIIELANLKSSPPDHSEDED